MLKVEVPTGTILVSGDWHGNDPWAEHVIRTAKGLGASAVVQVGDFGFWLHTSWGKKFYKHVQKIAEMCDMPVLWVAGNHDNWDHIENRLDGAVSFTDGLVTHLARGSYFKLGERLCFASGGAWSVDWMHREMGKSMWEQEQLTEEFVEEVRAERVHWADVDVMFGHESPMGPTISYKDELPVSVRQRELTSELLRIIRPAWHFGGHHHTRERWTDHDTLAECVVLDRDDQGTANFCVFDLGELRLV